MPYLGAAREGDGSVILMPDLSDVLLAWERPGHEASGTRATIDLVIDAIAPPHASDWTVSVHGEARLPWGPLHERVLLLSRPAAANYAAGGNPVGEIFLAGWDAFDRLASKAARALIDRSAIGGSTGLSAANIHAIARARASAPRGNSPAWRSAMCSTIAPDSNRTTSPSS
mgnify:CR=1 FL=1